MATQNVGGLDRLASLAAGGVLFLAGVLGRRASRVVLGGLLVYRGLSGHCKCYELLGVDTRGESEKG
jgi:uncharacterized membrane protein